MSFFHESPGRSMGRATLEASRGSSTERTEENLRPAAHRLPLILAPLHVPVPADGREEPRRFVGLERVESDNCPLSLPL